MDLHFTKSQAKQFKSGVESTPSRHATTLKKPRKNMKIIACAVNQCLEMGYTHVTSRMIRNGLEKSHNIETLWNVNQNADDDNGITRSIGDILGQHCLKLKKDKCGYVIPPLGITTKYIADLGYATDD